jgi:MarR family 2-MHQ and catechol resistance regulon transcriptional repressor
VEAWTVRRPDGTAPGDALREATVNGSSRTIEAPVSGSPTDSDEDALIQVRSQIERAISRGGEDLDPLALELTLMMYRVMGRLQAADQQEFSSEGLTTDEFNVLVIIDRADESITMKQIGYAISVRPTKLTNVIDSLTSRGFVIRDINSRDRRSFNARITKEGKQFLADFLPRHWRRMHRQMAGLSPDEQRQLVQILRKLFLTCGPEFADPDGND